MYGVGDRPHQNAELIAPVDRFLLDRQDDRAEILVVGEVVPVLGTVEVLLVRFLLDRGQLEALLLLPLLLDGGLLSAETLTAVSVAQGS